MDYKIIEKEAFKIVGIDHVGVTVNDLSVAKAFFLKFG